VHFVHNEFHMNWHGNETGSPQPDVSVLKSGPWDGLESQF